MRQFSMHPRVAVVNDFSLEFNDRVVYFKAVVADMVRRPLALNKAAPAALQIVPKKVKYALARK